MFLYFHCFDYVSRIDINLYFSGNFGESQSVIFCTTFSFLFLYHHKNAKEVKKRKDCTKGNAFLFIKFSRLKILRASQTFVWTLKLLTQIDSVIYFTLRFGLVNTINTYLSLRILAVWGWLFSLKCELIEFAIPNLFNEFL